MYGNGKKKRPLVRGRVGKQEGALRSPPSTPSQRRTRKKQGRTLKSIVKKGSRGNCPLRGAGSEAFLRKAAVRREPHLTRESSMKECSTQSRERVKGGTPLRGAGAVPLPSQGQSPCRVQRDEVPCRAGAVPLPESRGRASGGCRAKPCSSRHKRSSQLQVASLDPAPLP